MTISESKSQLIVCIYFWSIVKIRRCLRTEQIKNKMLIYVFALQALLRLLLHLHLLLPFLLVLRIVELTPLRIEMLLTQTKLPINIKSHVQWTGISPEHLDLDLDSHTHTYIHTLIQSLQSALRRT